MSEDVKTPEAAPVVEATKTEDTAGAVKPEPTLVTGGEEKKDSTTEVKKVVPEKYDLKLPEKTYLEASHVEKIASFAKEQGFSNEEAQRLLERDSSLLQTYVEAQQQGLKKQAENWISELKADKEVGGLEFDANIKYAQQAVGRFGDESLKQALDATGMGNFPGLVKMFVKIGKAMASDSFVQPGSQTGGKRSMEDIFYGETK